MYDNSGFGILGLPSLASFAPVQADRHRKLSEKIGPALATETMCVKNHTSRSQELIFQQNNFRCGLRMSIMISVKRSGLRCPSACDGPGKHCHDNYDARGYIGPSESLRQNA